MEVKPGVANGSIVECFIHIIHTIAGRSDGVSGLCIAYTQLEDQRCVSIDLKLRCCHQPGTVLCETMKCRRVEKYHKKTR